METPNRISEREFREFRGQVEYWRRIGDADEQPERNTQPVPGIPAASTENDRGCFEARLADDPRNQTVAATPQLAGEKGDGERTGGCEWSYRRRPLSRTLITRSNSTAGLRLKQRRDHLPDHEAKGGPGERA
jgi:hypothetical protein